MCLADECHRIAILKKGKQHIIYSWIVLICFIAGQAMVYSHQHLIKASSYRTQNTTQTQHTVTEKCQLCDAMHHNSMVVVNHQYFTPAVAADHFYTRGIYAFVNIALVLSAGRSPPIS